MGERKYHAMSVPILALLFLAAENGAAYVMLSHARPPPAIAGAVGLFAYGVATIVAAFLLGMMLQQGLRPRG